MKINPNHGHFWIELSDLGLVWCGAASPSIFIDSDTDEVILFPDQHQWNAQPFWLV